MRSAEILLACVVALALGWRECADATQAVKGANMPFISIVCNLVQTAEVVKRDALVDKETEFFAALNAALGIGRDDAPWQWALNSGNARLDGLAQAAIGNWSAEEHVTKDKAQGVCNTQARTLECDAIKAFKEYNRTKKLAAQKATAAIAPSASKQPAAWSTTGQEESRKPQHSRTLCLAATAVYLCTGESNDNPCTVNGKDPTGGPIASSNQKSASAVSDLWDKLNPAVCHAPPGTRTFHNGEDEHAIALFRYSLQDRKSGGGGKHTLGNCDNFNEGSDTGCIGYESDVASGKAYTAWMDNLRNATKALRAARSAYDLAKKHIDEIEQAKHRRKTRTHTELTQTKKHETLSAPRTQHSAKAKKEQAPQPGKEARAQAKTQTRSQETATRQPTSTLHSATREATQHTTHAAKDDTSSHSACGSASV
ncbi:hypothetical protein, conserved in T. vivax, partial [Trypanosoma vivax Y486]